MQDKYTNNLIIYRIKYLLIKIFDRITEYTGFFSPFLLVSHLPSVSFPLTAKVAEFFVKNAKFLFAHELRELTRIRLPYNSVFLSELKV